ncbi:MAG: 16S rRNA (cytidine(1402)-2'-O)-methyltransferase [Gammaproteobacteria bacterium]|nr:16S rRNA (cytidine(1402)-2'-O)-methyltransferase [Gammaproteobacteria bacterium]
MTAFGTLYIVATPIGNLEDLSPRAVAILKSVDCILAEDTRHSRKLLEHYQILTRLESYHEHNETEKAKAVIKALKQGHSYALISDAGTPLISDPGFDLVRAAAAEHIPVSPVPGASALIAALSASGLPSDRFYFAGFLPVKSKARSESLSYLKSLNVTVILYESKHRILESLTAIAEVFEKAPVVLAKEITKQFEAFLRGSAEDLLQQLKADPALQNGEFVLLISAEEKKSDTLTQVTLPTLKVLQELGEVLPKTRAAELVARWTGLPKRELYQKLMTPE